MSEIKTFEQLEGGKTFIVVKSNKTIFTKKNKEFVFLKFVRQVRAFPYNCMRLHDQKMLEMKKNVKVKEVVAW